MKSLSLLNGVLLFQTLHNIFYVRNLIDPYVFFLNKIYFWFCFLFCEQDCGGVWKVTPESGTLQSHDTVKLQLLFAPISDEKYKSEVLLYLDNDINPYISINISGHASHPKLTFNKTYINLPTVPLGITSSAMFTIYNSGYENLDLRYEIECDTNEIPLQVKLSENKKQKNKKKLCHVCAHV